jgi:hypothetical protein
VFPAIRRFDAGPPPWRNQVFQYADLLGSGFCVSAATRSVEAWGGCSRGPPGAAADGAAVGRALDGAACFAADWSLSVGGGGAAAPPDGIEKSCGGRGPGDALATGGRADALGDSATGGSGALVTGGGNDALGDSSTDGGDALATGGGNDAPGDSGSSYLSYLGWPSAAGGNASGPGRGADPAAGGGDCGGDDGAAGPPEPSGADAGGGAFCAADGGGAVGAGGKVGNDWASFPTKISP